MILKRKINRIYYRTKDRMKNKIKEYSPFLHELLFKREKSLAELDDCKTGYLRKIITRKNDYYTDKKEELNFY